MADASPTSQDALPSAEPTLPEPKPASDPKGGNSLPSSPPAAGQKRSAPSLLPAFEPLSSSPGLPRPLKRQNTGNGPASGGSHVRLKYPTPMPTSSTGILSSSPVRRPPFVRTSTSASEREPLSALPTVDLPENGEVLMMGRSSNSSHYQLSSNRLISRVHVKARYIPAADPLEPSKIEIICNGWNGVKLHCQGRTWELFKGDSFTSETEGTHIMLDVQDARVMIQWPKRGGDALANLSDSSWDDSPRSQANNAQRGGVPGIHSSPLRRTMRIQSPVSPTPGHLASSQRLQALFPRGDSQEDEPSIQIYEDEPEPELPPQKEEPVDVGMSMRTEATASFSSDLSEPDSDGENNPDEENDPIVHSFGPFGANISGRMASISTQSPKAKSSPKTTRSPNVARAKASPGRLGMSPRRDVPCEPLVPEKQQEERESESLTPLNEESPSPPPYIEIDPAITNHVVNQLAFSRLSSTPLSTIMQNLPGESKVGLTADSLRDAIEATEAIGIIERQGKDAAGKALESEYYYVPEHDNDEQRRAAVVDGLRKPSLRNCRKQHKQYYWKRPRTP